MIDFDGALRAMLAVESTIHNTGYGHNYKSATEILNKMQSPATIENLREIFDDSDLCVEEKDVVSFRRWIKSVLMEILAGQGPKPHACHVRRKDIANSVSDGKISPAAGRLITRRLVSVFRSSALVDVTKHPILNTLRFQGKRVSWAASDQVDIIPISSLPTEVKLKEAVYLGCVPDNTLLMTNHYFLVDDVLYTTWKSNPHHVCELKNLMGVADDMMKISYKVRYPQSDWILRRNAFSVSVDVREEL